MEQRVFTYRTLGLGVIATYTLLFALVAWFPPVLDLRRHSGPDIGFLFFGGIGFAIGAFGIVYLLAFLFEKVIVSGDQVTWIDRFGRQRMQFRFGDVQGVHVGPLSQPAGRGGGMGERCVVSTPSGRFVFSNNLSGYEDLKRLMQSQTTNH